MDVEAGLRRIQERLVDLGCHDDEVFDPRIAPVMWRLVEATYIGLGRRLGAYDERDEAVVDGLDAATLRRWRQGFDAVLARAFGRLAPALEGPPEELARIAAEIEAECDEWAGDERSPP
jgi:hypothetical protein